MTNTSASSAAHLRLLSSALGELARARTDDDVLRVAALASHRACEADGFVIQRRGSEPAHFSVEQGRVSGSPAPRVAATACVDSLQVGATAVASTRAISLKAESESSIDGETRAPREMVVIAVGVPNPSAAVAIYWLQQRTAAPDELATLDALVSATVIALNQRATDAAGALEREAVSATPRFYEYQSQVRGLFASIRSMVRRTSRFSDTLDDYAAHLDGRLAALARIYGFLVRVPDYGVDLEELVWSEFLAQTITQDQATVGGPVVRLSPRAAESLGLTLHELVMNAIKFGGFSHVDGRVSVVWKADPEREGWVSLHWQETFPRMPAAASRRGFGFELIEKTLPYELGAETTVGFTPTGLSCHISFSPKAAA